MTKKISIETEPTKAAPKKHRKLTKAEEEEYTRQFNEFFQKVSKAVQEGQIVLQEWRRNP